MKLAYFLMVHKGADQVDKLIDAVQDGENYVAVHADKKSPAAFMLS